MSRPPHADQGWLAQYHLMFRSQTHQNTPNADAQDSLQDVAARLASKTDAPALDQPRAYLQRSLENGIKQRYRASNAQPASPLHELAEHEHPQAPDDVESTVYTAQLAQALQHALAELPDTTQKVFAWHRLEGRTMPEIARELNVSVSTAEKHLTRCMRHLHERLRDYAP